jgi:TolB-like protein/class 3 adenylate cyclase
MASTRRLSAILAADVAGYSRLMGLDEEGTHERLKRHFDQLLNPKINEHRGRVVKNTGDGALAEFVSVVDAVRCAAAIQRGMIDRDAELPDGRRIRFRIGVNLGDIIVEDGDIFGDGVNIAARLEALAEPGGICVSGTVHDQVRDKLTYQFDDMGEQTVKNIARPIRAYGVSVVGAVSRTAGAAAPQSVGPLHARRILAAAVLAGVVIVAGSLWWLWPSPKAPPATVVAPALERPAVAAVPSAAPRLSIVVLPFINLSDDKDQQYFADGVTEDLTTDLSRIPDSFVISRNTAFTYKDKPVNAKQIGRELGVRYVLEGSVQRSDKQVRVNAQLIDAETDVHLWAERFERDTGDLFALQNEITNRIAVALNVALIGQEATRPTANPDALDYILRGRAASFKPPTRDNYAEMIGLFERALALDPDSAEAQSRLALALANRANSRMTDTEATDIARAEGLVGKVLETSPRSLLAHFVKGNLLRAQRRDAEAIPEYEMVLASDPNWVSAISGLGGCKFYTGSIEALIPAQEQAIRLSPRDPFIGNWYFQIGTALLLQSRTEEAIPWLERARSASPALPVFHARLASAYALQGESDRAAAELAEARRVAGDDRYSTIARLRALGYFGVPKTRALFEATYFVGLRKAGMPEE